MMGSELLAQVEILVDSRRFSNEKSMRTSPLITDCIVRHTLASSLIRAGAQGEYDNPPALKLTHQHSVSTRCKNITMMYLAGSLPLPPAWAEYRHHRWSLA